MKEKRRQGWRHRLHEIIFEADTYAGKLFDVVLLVMILISILVVMLDSEKSFSSHFTEVLTIAEWVFTILFSIEYILRIIVTKKPMRYIFSFLGIIDFISTMPTYLSLFFPGSHYLLTIRVLRLLRVFRVLKLTRYTFASRVIVKSLEASRFKIMVFLSAMLVIVVITGAMIYLIEGEENGFTSIPRSVYWAIVTVTTVGYGDLSPQTGLGQFLASILMITGYAIIAVPTGLITAEIALRKAVSSNTNVCENCHCSEHDDGAKFCKLCGSAL
ncbi:MAG: ion transporter [Bacteroidetes bacterium]|nr:ion transporter [Bacteroidota bacterium]MBU1719084.1 ion transporter [Bacteroidota bacterium]